jgi:hypothetical protein
MAILADAVGRCINDDMWRRRGAAEYLARVTSRAVSSTALGRPEPRRQGSRQRATPTGPLQRRMGDLKG